nr:unnamed protein product [Digitaria exilis]
MADDASTGRRANQQSRGVAARHGTRQATTSRGSSNECTGQQEREAGNAPGHMGLISENHPGMTAEIPACSPAPAAASAPAPAATASSAVSRALLAAASASIPRKPERAEEETEERRRAPASSWAAGGGWVRSRGEEGERSQPRP